MALAKDYTGLKFNKLTFISKAGFSNGKSHTPLWLCRCDCGKEKIVAATDVVNNRTKSCGCNRGIDITDKSIADGIVGKKYNNLTIIGVSLAKSSRNRPMLVCKCDCGVIKPIIASRVINGHTKSCGCITAVRVSESKTTHGMSNSSAYNTWHGLIQRCYNENNKDYPSYGGRGIMVCDRWKNSFETFLADMGNPPKGTTIDRINNSGNYEPNNCHWATAKIQCNNRRNNTIVSFRGEQYNLCQLATQLNVSRYKLSYWITHNKNLLEIND